jgi:hypothetical protein
MEIFAALLGTVVGAVLTHVLSKSSERKRWIADKKIEEYQELLRALMRAAAVTAVHFPSTSPNKQQEIQSAHSEALQILTTRLFVAKDIKREGIIQKWEQYLREFQQAKDFHLFGNRCGEMIVSITNLALRDAV